MTREERKTQLAFDLFTVPSDSGQSGNDGAMPYIGPLSEIILDLQDRIKELEQAQVVEPVTINQGPPPEATGPLSEIILDLQDRIKELEQAQVVEPVTINQGPPPEATGQVHLDAVERLARIFKT